MLPLLFLFASLVNDVRGLIARHDFAAAERAVATHRAQSGSTAEAAAAISWLARGALAEKRLDAAARYAGEARNLSLELLKTRKLDGDAWLPTALGASIEVEAQVRAARGERAEAVQFLQEQSAAWAATSIAERIHKNLNLLSLEGKPAPPVTATSWIGANGPGLRELRGKTVLLFFWAHWCADCKGMAQDLAGFAAAYKTQRLVVMAPTKLYGYVAGGKDAPASVELPYIGEVRRQFYPGLSAIPVPVSAAAFQTYGASTTPTIVLIDRSGMVRLYHPGAMSPAELGARIQSLLRG